MPKAGGEQDICISFRSSFFTEELGKKPQKMRKTLILGFEVASKTFQFPTSQVKLNLGKQQEQQVFFVAVRC